MMIKMMTEVVDKVLPSFFFPRKNNTCLHMEIRF